MKHQTLEVAVLQIGLIDVQSFQSDHHYVQNTNIEFLQAGCPSCQLPTNSVKALKIDVLRHPAFSSPRWVVVSTHLSVSVK